MIKRDIPVLCNETYIAKLNRINLVKRPETYCKPHKQRFRGDNVTILEWPSYSPDVDPIENVWKCIKDEINQKKRISKKWWEKWRHIGTVRVSNLFADVTTSAISISFGLTIGNKLVYVWADDKVREFPREKKIMNEKSSVNLLW